MSADSAPPAKPRLSAADPIVKCPQCGEDTVYTLSNPYRPFCSERCKNLDLGAWANEQFRMDAVEGPDDDPDSTATGGPASGSSDWRH